MNPPNIPTRQSASTIIFVMAVLTLAAPAKPGSAQSEITQAQQSTSVAESPSQPTQSINVDDVTSDTAIRDRLRDIYAAGERAGWLSSIDVSVSSGIVMISGVADTDSHQQWAENVARNTEDVVAVISKITLDESVDLTATRDVIASSIRSLWNDFLKRSPLLFVAALLLLLTAVLAKTTTWIVHRVLDKRGLRVSLKDLIYQLTSIAAWLVGLLVATVIAFPGMTPSRALTVLGLGSVAIGFAFKDIFENFFAGVLILWRYPFDRGDFIECDGLMGKVEQITIRNTLIRKLDGELSVVPNATLFKNNVDVLTSQPQRRVRIACGIAYDEDVDQAREIIREAVQKCSTVQGKRTVEVFANQFASSSIEFEVAWWTGSKPLDIRQSRDEVVGAIKSSLDQAGIEIPFPYRTILFKNLPDDRPTLEDAEEPSHSN